MSGGAQFDAAPTAHLLTEAECYALGEKILDMVRVGQAQVDIDNLITVGTRFARGDVRVVDEREWATVSLLVSTVDGHMAIATTSRIDDVGLRTLVEEAERVVGQHRSSSPIQLHGPRTYAAAPRIYFGDTVDATAAETQAAVLRASLDAAEREKLIAAGDVTIELNARARINSAGFKGYVPDTYGEFSLTARTKDGTGSGWGWSGFEDWSRVRPDTVIARAVDLGVRSANPVAIEPGRYTVILEPTAVASISQFLDTYNDFNAEAADLGYTPYGKDPVGTNKIGMQMLDSRLTVSTAPWDPDIPSSTVSPGSWAPVDSMVRWFDKGILTNLTYTDEYAAAQSRPPVRGAGSLRIEWSGRPSTLDEMIASTKRGVWVNRFSGISLMNLKTMLVSGTTRDGTFLIENGKITKPIKNLRFTESPFFVLNKLDATGVSERASRGVVAPRMKVRDFDFTSLTDAV